ncbi:hypothetical protein FI667_g952, partial [Globisporangium splendens]
MYWSAALQLKTSREQQYKPSYGSFGPSNSSSTSSTRSNSRSGSSGNIRIPQSIPEHHPILQFASPRLQHNEEEKLAEYYEMEQASSYANAYNSNNNNNSSSNNSSNSTTTVTVTASETLQMLLLSSRKLEEYVNTGMSSTDSTTTSAYTNKNTFSHTSATANDPKHPQQHINSHHPDTFSYLNATETTSLIGGATHEKDDPDHVNYWVLERERLRAKRDRRILSSLSKTAALAEDEPTSAWRTGVIMCSVPLLLIILFVIFVLVSGDSGEAASVGASASSAWEIVVKTVTGASGSRSASLRGSE